MSNQNVLVFNVKPLTLKRVIQTVNQYGHAILHGDGMVYVNKPEHNKNDTIQPSAFHKEFSQNSAAGYVLYFDKSNVNTVPQSGDNKKDMDALIQMFLHQKAIDIAAEQQAAEPMPIYTINDIDEVVQIPVKTRAEIEQENATLKAEIEKLKASKNQAPQTAESAKTSLKK